jgi:hypothetical protein
MRKMTIEEMEEADAMADVWREQERERHWQEALENESNNVTESL